MNIFNMDITHHEVDKDPVKQRKTELVERKGLGHPDSISDGIAESVSQALSREYRDRFGTILHHNTDEVQLVAGEANPDIDSEEGEIIEPIYILLTGRATKEFNGEKIPVDRIALDAAKNYIDSNFKQLETSHIEFESRIGETSTDLEAVYERDERLSNDTSFGVGHAPLSPAEKAVREIEEEVRELEKCGEDVKVMGLREEDTLTVTIAAAGISSRIRSLEDYKQHVREVKETATEVTERNELEADVHVNTADNIDAEEVYLTVTGTSAEMGDDGSVGRGNRVNGLITPHRSMSMEAASGKNPVTHIGKIYNLLAQEIAKDIYQRTGEYAEVKLLSQIGKPISDPRLVEVETSAEESDFEHIVEQHLQNIDSITDRCVEGDITTF